jgi:hypothetical protein
MSQINVNPSDSGDRTAAASINMVTVLIVLVVLVVLSWFLFAGPLRGTLYTTPNQNPPAQQQPAPDTGRPSQPSPAPQPSPAAQPSPPQYSSP